MTNIFKSMENVEKNFYGKENYEKPWEKEKEDAMRKVEKALEHIRYGEIARTLLTKHSLEKIEKSTREEIEEMMSPDYGDPAMIVAICRNISPGSQIAKKDLH